MRAAQHQVPSFLTGALIAVALAALLISVRYRLEETRDLVRQHELLEDMSAALGAELDRGARLALQSHGGASHDGWHAWQLEPAGGPDATAHLPPIPEATLRRALSAHRTMSATTLALLGPFATAGSANALLLARANPTGGAPGWTGSWELVDDFLAHARVADPMRQGLRVQLYDAGEGVALYQSDAGEFNSQVTVPVHLAGSALELRAARGDGGSVPLKALSSSLLVLLAVVLWACHELRRGTALRNAAAALSEAEARRRDTNQLYGNALESLAALESRLHLVSTYDTVTGLANRSSLIRRIEATLDSMRQSKQGALSVMAIGFDHLQQIGGSFGAEFASRVLVVAAERLEFLLPSKELLFRIGDSQLAVVLTNADVARGEELARRILTEVEAPIALDSHTFVLRPSIGIAETTSGYEYAEALVDRANTALAAVARDALTRWCRFDSAVARESISRLQLEADLDRAFDSGQLVLEYEPFIVPDTRAVAGFEALVRWNHPTEGRLMPGKFVPIALQAGLSHRLNDWLIREVARQAAAWRREGHEDFFINFNLSAEAFLRPNLADEIGAVLAEHDLPGSQLVVELTESTLIQDMRSAARTLQRLSDLGVGAWLDDFGTGYSSLSHLRSLPLKAVKIDRSFIERIEVDSRDFGFLKALIDLISYLGMQSIAEGIETATQFELLGLTTCDLYQGHYFCRSLPAAQAVGWLSAAKGGVRRAVSA
ncbi:MAG TPA: EAL domain-containing protein [Steroidobacteraceae bacterium]|jgi:diguanylate cyclase (GGDEF)-like protein|nr:EAL domain-containing protein [Steroidobacteraceae bacterium]